MNASAQLSAADEVKHLRQQKEGGGSVTLEPGGQFELSGAPVDDLHATAEETRNHLEQVHAYVLFCRVSDRPSHTLDICCDGPCRFGR